MKKGTSTVLALLLVGVAAGLPTTVEIDSACGRIQGKAHQSGLRSFYSIPFAKPPRRWQHAEKPGCSAEGTLDATTPGNICWQFGGTDDFCSESRVKKQSEDCLTLDIHTKYTKSDSVPVIVFIHGGSLIFGDSTVYQNIQNLADDGDLVLVTIQYRLAAHGFLAIPALDGANFGFADQQLALHWVQEHIGDYGGDSGRVTLMGQSSGSTSVFMHLMSTQSKGLFHRAISLSASPNITMSLAQAQEQNMQAISAPGGKCSRAASSSNSTQVRTPATEEFFTKGTPPSSPHLPGPQLLQCLHGLSALDVASLFPDSFNVDPELPQATAGQSSPGLPAADGVSRLLIDLLDQEAPSATIDPGLYNQ
jgi:para-nitrobenzyl esterase